MALQLSDAGRQFADIEIGDLHGQRGLVSRILIELKLLTCTPPTGDHLAQLRALTADVSLQGEQGGPLLIGRAVLADSGAGLKQAPFRNQAKLRLALDVTRPQLEAWERVRAGRKFTLSLVYQGLAMAPEVVLSNLHGSDHRVISQSDWSTVLEELDYRRTILVEVPVADPAVHPALADAAHAFARATTLLYTGPAKEVVGACRLALEALAHALGEDSKTYNLVELVRNNPSLGKGERFAVLRKSLTVIAHPAHHGDPTAAAIDWQYDDAVALVAETAAVLRYHTATLERRNP